MGLHGPELPDDVDPLAWSVVSGLTLAVVTALTLLVTGHLDDGLALVLLVPATAGCIVVLFRALVQRP
jgi:UPF0716 family protein affecting phage T7 exclusion